MARSPKEGGLCWKCRRPAADEDNYCRHCGADLRAFPWYYQHWGIIVLTFLALGPLSVIFVWRSPVFDRTTKLVYTAVLAVFAYLMAAQLYGAYKALQGLMSGAALGL